MDLTFVWNDTMSPKDGLSPLRKLNLIMRFSYTLPFFMAALCGSLYSLFYDPELWLVALIPLDVLFLAMFVNFSNDYFDHKSGVDEERFQDAARYRDVLASELNKKIYWEGNQFDNGLVTEKQGKLIMAFLVAMAVVLSIPIVWYGGLLVVGLGLVALFLAYFYTAPPINMGARGLGEFNVAISFFMMVFFAFYVITRTFDWEVLVFATAIACGMGLMRAVDAMSGYESHLKHGEKDLAVRMGGLEEAVPVVKVWLVLFYVLVASMLLFDLVHALLLLTLPISKKAWDIMSAKEDLWNVRIAPLFFGVALTTQILFLLTLIVRTFLSFPVL
jgi:1,4-dihydroxy-2-naphthoate octaprenyltransferase